jgi:hypothetical protein
LRLVNKDEYLPSSTGLVYQHFLKPQVQRDFVTLRDRQLELRSEKAKQLISIALRLKNERSARGIAVLRQQLKQQRGLSHPWGPQKDGKSQVRFD